MVNRFHALVGPSLAAALLVAPTSARAASYCVANADELVAALASAGVDGDGLNDTIRIKVGTYQRQSGDYAFEYVSDGGYLEISGGWVDFGAPCNGQTFAPGATVLDGGGVRGVFRARAVDAFYDLRIASLTFRDGESDEAGAGLRVDVTPASTGRVRVDASVFDGNHSTSSAGAVQAVARQDTLQFRNNLLVDNVADAGNGYVANLVVVNDTAVTTLVMQHNTVVGSRCTAIDAANCLAAVQVCCDHVAVDNNAFYDNDVADLRIGALTVAVVRNNAYETINGHAPAASVGNVVTPGNPGFTAYATGNYVPRRLTPLFDGGTTGVLPATDITGLPRTLGAKPDIGAFESPAIYADGFESPQ